MSFVHAKCTVEERRYLWRNLLADKPNSHPRCIGGDINVITAPHEKRGGRPFAIDEGVELVSFMEEAGVLDVGFSGSSFTWCNNRRGRARILKRLDRLLINGACLELSAAIFVTQLARHLSDHAPLKISFVSRLDNKPRPFRFLNVWTAKPELLEAWNKYSFGNIFEAVQKTEVAVQLAEEVADQDDTEESQVALRKAQAELRYALSIEEQFWSQKA
ncbi:uncharacterized protein LOC113774005 [Coffea eugenioides]|uniref:uncharacterized protein LOC113774005 n=1 Tax=Coffea eugenioides TaxID=49369 RepID=UPI000F6068E4|nr:uncharacterized protein LOC113774005 [Coffea eugenioides]